jgi:hypothetical protein
MAPKPNKPAIFVRPTLLVPAMADWTPERVEVSREPETQVWDGPKTVVEIPWWLRNREEPTGITKKEPLRPLRPRAMSPLEALSDADESSESDDRDLIIDDDSDTVPSTLSFTPFFQRDNHHHQCDPEQAFEDTFPLLLDPELEDPFPRQVTSYDVKIPAVVDSPFEDTEEVVVPLPRVTPAPKLRAGRLGLLSLLVLALGTLVAATFKAFNLFPRLQP